MAAKQKKKASKADADNSAEAQRQNEDAAGAAGPDANEGVGNEDAGCADAETAGIADDGARAGDDDAESIEGLREERDRMKDQLLRALADVENMRRRTDRELEGARKYGHVGFSRDLVGVLDNIDRALATVRGGEGVPDADAVKALLDGLELGWKEIQSTMERHGIRRISPKGEKFDYNFHQAMFEAESAEHPPGTVVEVVQHGYALHDRLLRPAMVGVSKAVPAEAGDAKAKKKG